MILYHYTSAAGLQGILQSKSLWVSDHRFLNDRTEFLYGWQMVTDAFRDREAEVKHLSPSGWYTVDGLRQHNEREGVHAFVGSLSSRGDLLSQWRGYNRGEGFSTGFNAEWLHRNAMAQAFDLAPVIYEADAQRAAARDVINLLINLLSASPLVEQTPSNMSAQFKLISGWWMQALKVALTIKNEHFVEEQETRLIWVGTSWPPRLKTRTGPSGLIPYQSFQFNEVITPSLSHPSNFGIEEIIVGPAAREHQFAAVDALLASQHMRLTIRRSEIPYVAE